MVAKQLLILTAFVETATGLMLLVSPALVVAFLLGASLDAPPALVVARMAGAALLSLGCACWLASHDGPNRAVRGLVAAMLMYNGVAVAVLAIAGAGARLVGVLTWPAVALHAALAVWCIACLYAIDVEHRIPHRVSSGIAEQYLSVAVDQIRPHHLVATVANPTAGLWTVPIASDIQTESAVKPIQTANIRALSPRYAGDHLAFLSSKGRADGLWTLDNSGTLVELWKGGDGGVVAAPEISPDGNRICFSYRKQGRAELYVINANGTGLTTLAKSIEVQSAASWSPDGRWVAVAANQGEGTRVFKIPLDGGPPVRLRDTLSFNPVWSPDNRFIVYSEQHASASFDVKTMTPDGAPVVVPAVCRSVPAEPVPPSGP
jgi:hypothetical protein